jgi:predicted dehydrogenase
MKTKRYRDSFFTRPHRGLLLLLGLTISYLLATGASPQGSNTVNNPVKLITLDPGHFHAALIQKEMYPGVSEQVNVYAPLGPDLIAHLERVANFNLRPGNPTHWKLEVHTGPDFMERMLREHPGNVVVLSGRNQGKIDRIGASVRAGLHVLADKPWIISHMDLPKLEAALNTAEEKGVVAYDIMTERYEITTMLQKELVNDAGTFGTAVAGTEQEPGVFMESVHYLMKTVAGVPNLRPAWFFDISQQGEGLADVGTHLVDLVPWILFPELPIDYRADVRVLKAKRWPTVLTKTDFQRVTGEKDFPGFLKANVKDGQLNYYCNTQVAYAVRDIHTTLRILWNYEAPAGGGDTHFAVVMGSKSRVEVRQGAEQKYRPELYVVPRRVAEKAEVLAALQKKVASLQGKFPGIAVEALGAEMHVRIPDQYRVGHEAHFAQVTNQFLKYLKNPGALPRWEKANMLAKYFVTTKGVELSQ